MPLPLMLLTALLAGALLIACGGDGGASLDPGAAETIGELSGDLEAQLDDANLDDLDESARLQIDQNCTQLSEEAAGSSLGDELTDLCGDIRQALTEGSQDALNEARQRLDEVTGAEGGSQAPPE